MHYKIGDTCVGLTIAAKFTITIVIDSQKYYHDSYR